MIMIRNVIKNLVYEYKKIKDFRDFIEWFCEYIILFILVIFLDLLFLPLEIIYIVFLKKNIEKEME